MEMQVPERASGRLMRLLVGATRQDIDDLEDEIDEARAKLDTLVALHRVVGMAHMLPEENGNGAGRTMPPDSASGGDRSPDRRPAPPALLGHKDDADARPKRKGYRRDVEWQRIILQHLGREGGRSRHKLREEIGYGSSNSRLRDILKCCPWFEVDVGDVRLSEAGRDVYRKMTEGGDGDGSGS